MKLSSITIAVTQMDRMIAFYNAVFSANLAPQGPFYSGQLGEFGLLLCPNEFAGVEAKQNRQQFRFIVDDLDAVLKNGLGAGGEQIDAVQEANNQRIGSLRDPDGNSIEFCQAI
jgi:catechol 2,3-dioxygenase-like lactoylglutathione lyase family enzyme